MKLLKYNTKKSEIKKIGIIQIKGSLETINFPPIWFTAFLYTKGFKIKKDIAK